MTVICYRFCWLTQLYMRNNTKSSITNNFEKCVLIYYHVIYIIHSMYIRCTIRMYIELSLHSGTADYSLTGKITATCQINENWKKKITFIFNRSQSERCDFNCEKNILKVTYFILSIFRVIGCEHVSGKKKINGKHTGVQN